VPAGTKDIILGTSLGISTVKKEDVAAFAGYVDGEVAKPSA